MYTHVYLWLSKMEKYRHDNSQHRTHRYSNLPWVRFHALQRNMCYFQCHHMSIIDFVVSPPGCGRSVTDSKFGTPMRRSYVVPMRWMVICEYEVPRGALNLNSTKLPRPWSPCGSSPSRKNPHGRTGNRTRNLMISSQKLWPLDHEDGLILFCSRHLKKMLKIFSFDSQARVLSN
jgi:hypothetical protein